jgi:hypothetical protein
MLEEANVEERQLKLLVDSPMRKGLLNLFAGMTGIVGFCFGLMPIIGVFFFPFSVMAIVIGVLGGDRGSTGSSAWPEWRLG